MSNYKQLDEKELLMLLKVQDHRAFEELYKRNWESSYKVACKRLRDKETCKDIVHDVFADLWNQSNKKDIENLSPYLHTAVRYKIYSLMTKGRMSPHFVEPFENMAASSLTADAWFQYSELEHLVSLWIETLPEKRRKIFQLRYMENLTTKEISVLLNISQKTVQNQLATSLRDLQSYIGHYLSVVMILYSYFK
ncbi:RNA polymerase sigma factor [Pararcticibacter amylolyticus]|uniref:RNA polymerase subunit sigma-24 n=1 Tax=Pararcticibacter amylolyticus TaxID=2173175 RepID=A0A2U2PE99_9SPHI|nr:sigma-70 family RNA polymerase sigma factor [Pararcticibacter amylolyticus]PWG79703.1 RNA polymerase subunit sigma-24 [Pararcticibacter amylolyticus]